MGFCSDHCNISSTYKYILYSIIYVHVKPYIVLVYIVGIHKYILNNGMNYSVFCLWDISIKSSTHHHGALVLVLFLNSKSSS